MTIPKKKKSELLRILIAKGAEVNKKDRNGLTPFQVAVDVGDKESALFLYSKGARRLAPLGIGYSKYYDMFLEFPDN